MQAKEKAVENEHGRQQSSETAPLDNQDEDSRIQISFGGDNSEEEEEDAQKDKDEQKDAHKQSEHEEGEDMEEDDEQHQTLKSTHVGLTHPENQQNLLSGLQSILKQPLPTLDKSLTPILVNASGAAKRRIQRIIHEEESELAERELKYEKRILRQQSFVIPTTDRIPDELEFLQTARLGVVKLFNTIVQEQKSIKQEEAKSSGYETLKEEHYDLDGRKMAVMGE